MKRHPGPDRIERLDMDIGPEDFDRLVSDIGAKVAELTGLPLETAEELAVSVVDVRIVEDGMLVFSDSEERPVLRLPFSAFADLLEDEEDT